MGTTHGEHFASRQATLESCVARVLRAGSLMAAALIAAGIGMVMLGMARGAMLVTAGVIVLVLTPVVRVATALVIPAGAGLGFCSD